MQSPNYVIPYSSHGLKELSRVLGLHRKMAWIDPASNQMAIKESQIYLQPYLSPEESFFNG